MLHNINILIIINNSYTNILQLFLIKDLYSYKDDDFNNDSDYDDNADVDIDHHNDDDDDDDVDANALYAHILGEFFIVKQS